MILPPNKQRDRRIARAGASLTSGPRVGNGKACGSDRAPAAGRRGLSGPDAVPARIGINMWLSAPDSAEKICSSTDTIARRGIPWQPQRVAHKIRYKYLILDPRGQRTRRYYEPDVEALLYVPNAVPVRSRPRIIPRFVVNRHAPAGEDPAQGPISKRRGFVAAGAREPSRRGPSRLL